MLFGAPPPSKQGSETPARKPRSDRRCQILRGLALFQPKGAEGCGRVRVRLHKTIVGEAFATKNRVITGLGPRQRETAGPTR
jgi:hypothetical protein